jgi:hypothetical protein
MERTYYPSIPKVMVIFYILPGAGWLFGYGIRVLVDFVRGSSLMSFNWAPFLGFWVAWAGLRALSDGFRAERLAIKITKVSISGPIAVGRAEPIQFDEIDYQKTFKANSFLSRLRGKRVYSLDGDQISVQEVLFQAEQVAEIWAALDQARQQRTSLSGS